MAGLRSAFTAVLGCAVMITGAVAPTAAQTFPERELRILVGFAAGSTTDVFVRYLAEKIRPLAGKPIVVENKTGAGGNIAVGATVTSKPDGHSLLVTTGGTVSYNVHLFKNLGFDPIKDLEPVTTVVAFPFVLTVNATKPIKTVPELVAYMKAKSEPGNYGSVGGAGIVLSELLKHEAKFEAVQVGYRSVTASLNDMQSGNLDFMFMDPTTAMAQVRDGRVRALAVTTPTRAAALPDLPTLTELGYPRIDRVSWLAALLPAKTPEPIIRKWNEWLTTVLSEDDTKAYFRKVYMEANPGTPEALRKLQQDEIAKWADLVKLAKIEPQ